MISIVIPYYNNAKHIDRTIKSVSAQSLQDFEVLIINDASPDWHKALPVIEAYNDERIKIISHEENKNGAAARNTGIKAAKGDYIAFLDADDEWLPNHLESALTTLKAKKSNLCYCQAIVLSKKGTSVMPTNGIKPNQRISDYLFVEGSVMFTPTLVVKSSLVRQVLFNDKLRRHQDYDFLLRCEAQGIKTSFVDKPNVVVHWENNNPKSKGGTWDFSLEFAKDYKPFFSPRAYSRFILTSCVLPLLKERKHSKAFSVFLKYIFPLHLNKLNYYFILSYLLFGSFKHPYKWKK
ncbi:glycosyltransferase family 2 protein [Marinilabilia rubra]|uniref:Glycosyltransferase 2-like domain-containing protein n=1 Tax=Marinilabilia rubra TaxID=2162893 RepID=A0A2U2B3Z3_9BACT|nr:glycosyltransferase family 2 protein [Marinilabilia rubra]PWD97764.1 hypothetical protein DDZ16_19200 [Marinilabilia rubra]